MAFGHISAMVRSASSNHYATQNDRFLLPLDNFGKGQQKNVRVEVDLEACWGTSEAGLHFVGANLVLK